MRIFLCAPPIGTKSSPLKLRIHCVTESWVTWSMIPWTVGLNEQVGVWLVPEAVGTEKGRTNVTTSSTNLVFFTRIVCEELLNLSGL